ncbi:MAG TPA: 16S rRNA (guanine(966)-N(2))-methyltransferase RsmD [Terriglobales bacterium]|nr:16S rRNA (guanine(966)-N(2))-methyltransferase RsmD [Terriglobales bacterium]
MRIIAGQFRSRALRSLPGAEIRPTSDRLRETLFNVLASGNSSALDGSILLDLFAGTGAVGIEALSRGAAMVYFVEMSKAATELIHKNLQPLGVEDRCRILRQEARRAISALESQAVKPDFIFLDPPYALQNAYRETLTALANSSLAESALVIAEHEKKFDPGEEFGALVRTRRLDQGDAALSFYRKVQQTRSD